MATSPEEQATNAAKLAEKEGAVAAEKERYNKALVEANKIKRDGLTLEQSLLEIENERRAIEQQSRDLMAERASIAQEQLGAVNAKIAAQDALNDQTQALTELERQRLNEEIAANENIIEQKKQLLEESKNISESLSNQTSELKNQKSSIDKVLASQKKFGDDVNASLDAARKSAESFSGVAKNMAGDMPVIGGQLQKLMSLQTKVPKLLNSVATAAGNMSGAIGGFLGPHIATAATTLSTAITGIGIATVAVAAGIILFVGKIMTMALEVNRLSKALGAATGFGDQFNTEIAEMGAAGHMAGIGFKESASALTALTTGLSSFNPKAEETNMHVGMTVARLEKLGVASASSVKSIDHMQKAMGLSAEKAADLTAQIARSGKEIGITGTKMINDFNAASGRLAIYGNKNTKVFKELAAQAKATGIEMQSLLAISKNFDTFDAAAESAGKLNAVLGTQLSTIEMMNATDSERIMILKQEVQAAVGNFDSLDKFEKQYVQQAMGVASVDEAQRLLNMSTAEYQKLQQGQKESADIQAEMAEATEELVPMMDQLKLAAMQFFMVFIPIVEGFAALISYMSPLVGFLGQAAKGLAFLAIAWLLVNIQALTFSAVMTALGWVALVIAITAVVAVLGYLADGFLYLYKIFKKKINPDFVQIFNFLADSLMGMLNPLKFVSAGVKKITGAFTGLFKSAKKDSANMTKDGFDIKAMATMDTAKISAGIKNIKSAVMELSSVKIDGFLAMTTDGTSSSFVMGSDGLIKSISEGKLTVDVKMPEMKIPPITVNVYVGNNLLKTYIDDRINEKVGKSG